MKMPEEIDNLLFAPCGMNCMVCYVHLKDKKPCSGCRLNDDGKPEHCKKCKIKSCIQKKGLTYCYECSEFPCKQIKSLEKSYNKRYNLSLIDNSKMIQKEGMIVFKMYERKKWMCKICSGVISLHDAECSNCKRKY
ncbi:DUF3795 domain-containing protein [bacterium]|nr:DUF3795 domain-containing protein [bacterium]